MICYLLSVPWLFGAFFFVFFFIFLSLFGLFIVRKLVPYHVLKDHHDVASFAFNVIGVIYAVLLGFIAVKVQERFNQVGRNIQSETSIIVDLYRDVAIFPDELKKEIRAHIKDYAMTVLNEEWKLMAQGEISMHARNLIQEIWRDFYKLDPTTEKEKLWLGEAIDKLNGLSTARIERIDSSRESLGSLMWTFLIAGGAITIFSMYFFSVERIELHLVMTALLSGSVAFMIFLILSLDTVFYGDVSIKPDALERVVNLFDGWD
jgi:hypothetical protein